MEDAYTDNGPVHCHQLMLLHVTSTFERKFLFNFNLVFYLQFHSDFYIQVTSSESTGVTGNFIDYRNNLNTAIKVDPLIDLEGYAYSFPFFLLVVISLFQNVSRSVFVHLFIYFLFFFYQVGKCTTYDESLAVW